MEHLDAATSAHVTMHALPRRAPHTAADLQPWVARFGRIVVRVDLPAAWGELRVPWEGAAPSDATWTLTWRDDDGQPPAPETPNMTATGWSATHCAWASTHAWGTLDRATGTGHVWLRTPNLPAGARLELLKEAMLLAAAADVTWRGGVVLHAAVLGHAERAWVVSGPSTAGKTTLCGRVPGRWWSDEYAYLVPTAGGWEAWRHREFRGGEGEFPWTAPLGGVVWLGPDRSQTTCTPMASPDAFARLGYQLLTLGPLTTQASLDALALLLSAHRPRVLSHHLGTPVDAVWSALAGEPDA